MSDGKRPPTSDPIDTELDRRLSDIGSGAKRGPPFKPIDIELCRRLAGIGCTVEEIATGCGVKRATLYERMASVPELAAAIEDGREEGRSTLRRLQWHRANAGSDTMLIWLGKQMLGQRDKSEHALTGADGGPIKTEVVDERPTLGALMAEFNAARVVATDEETRH